MSSFERIKGTLEYFIGRTVEDIGHVTDEDGEQVVLLLDNGDSIKIWLDGLDRIEHVPDDDELEVKDVD